MNTTINEVLQFAEQNDIKFVRLAFCDIFGTEKNISIMADELPRAFKYGISFDASAVKGYIVKIGAETEFYLFKLDDQGEPTFPRSHKTGVSGGRP